jgi:hypothetical protein
MASELYEKRSKKKHKKMLAVKNRPIVVSEFRRLESVNQNSLPVFFEESNNLIKRI